MKAIGKTLRIAPTKLSLIAGMVRNKKATDALNLLSFTPKKGAKMLHKVVQSAVANAENNFKQERDSLFIKEVIIGKAMTMKRGVPVSRGRVYPVLKRNAHVTVILGVDAAQAPAKKAAKAKEAKTEHVAAPEKPKKTTKSTKK